jgi:hypothetical protein
MRVPLLLLGLLIGWLAVASELSVAKLIATSEAGAARVASGINHSLGLDEIAPRRERLVPVTFAQ